MTDDTTDETVRCVQCEHTREEADDGVVFHELNDGDYWCSACRSLMDGWKQEDAFKILVNDSLSDEHIEELRQRANDAFDNLRDDGRINADAGERKS